GRPGPSRRASPALEQSSSGPSRKRRSPSMSASPSVASTPDPSASDAAEAAVEAITGAANQDVTCSLELTQDQKDIRDWVHGFAADVVRPAAHEWDEKEQTPWPIIEEAAKIGLYGFEGLAQFFADPSGLTLPIVNEELFWGDAGIGMSIMGTSLAVAAIFGQGTGQQIAEWIPRCFGPAEVAGVEGVEGRAARVGDGRCLPRRLPRARRPRARRQGQARRPHSARTRGQEGQNAGRDADVRGLAADGRRASAGDRARRLRVCARLRKGARTVRPQDHREPV